MRPENNIVLGFLMRRGISVILLSILLTLYFLVPFNIIVFVIFFITLCIIGAAHHSETYIGNTEVGFLYSFIIVIIMMIDFYRYQTYQPTEKVETKYNQNYVYVFDNSCEIKIIEKHKIIDSFIIGCDKIINIGDKINYKKITYYTKLIQYKQTKIKLLEDDEIHN
jgi:uncharacterized membrane protein